MLRWTVRLVKFSRRIHGEHSHFGGCAPTAPYPKLKLCCCRTHRMVSKGASARVQVKLRTSGSSAKKNRIPLETFASNKSMGRILLRRGGETVAAGKPPQTARTRSHWAMADEGSQSNRNRSRSPVSCIACSIHLHSSCINSSWPRRLRYPAGKADQHFCTAWSA